MQHDLFPTNQSRWDRALQALEELDVEGARRSLGAGDEPREDRPELQAMHAALEFLARAGLGPQSGAQVLSSALWSLPARSRSGELSLAATSKALEALARRITSLASRQPPGSRLFEPALLARAHLLLQQERKAAETLRTCATVKDTSAPEQFVWADLWSWQGHEDARVAYGRGLTLDPSAFEPLWTRAERLRALHEELARERGDDEARERLLAEAWWRGIVDLPAQDDEWAERCRRALAPASDSTLTPARRFSLLLAADVAGRSISIEAREELHALDPELFRRVIERLKRRSSTKP